MSNTNQATISHHHKTIAPASVIWGVLTTVPNWKDWNSGIHASSIDGPFIQGSWITMVMPNQEFIKSQIVEVVVDQIFVDETKLGDVTVRVTHLIEPQDDGRTNITYKVDVVGENANDICFGVSSDFPEVMLALAENAEGKAIK